MQMVHFVSDEEILAAKNVQLKKHEQIPIVVVANHDEVVRYIHDNIRSKHLPLNGFTILHFDSHPDMLLPLDMPAETVYKKEELYLNLDIGNWILPLAFAGHFRKLIWLKPPWANQMKDSSQKFIIGKDISTGTIRLNSKENYFVYEQLYKNEKELLDSKEVDLEVITAGTVLINKDDDYARIDKLLADMKATSTSYILDIDLDFFSTYNPFRRMYVKMNIFDRLKKFYQLDPPSENATDEELYQFMEKRAKQLEELEQVFSCFHNNKPISEHVRFYKELLELKADIEKQYTEENQIDWNLFHVAGLTIDDSELPDHESTSDELNLLYNIFNVYVERLKSMPPVLVTISRSVEDGYTPNYLLDELENKVLTILKSNLNCVGKPIYDCNDSDD